MSDKLIELQDRALLLRDSVDFAVDMAKKFNPDQPRDEKGRWAGGGVTLYHGTQSKALARILRQGLRIDVAGRGGGEASLKPLKQGGKILSEGTPKSAALARAISEKIREESEKQAERFRAHSRGHVFATPEINEAVAYANSVSGEKGKRPIILRIVIPRSKLKTVANKYPGQSEVKIAHDIKPEWIKAVATGVPIEVNLARPDRKQRTRPYITWDKELKWRELRKAEDEDGEEFFVVVSVEDDDELEMAKKFNPNQPRDKEGQWTEGGGTGFNIDEEIKREIKRAMARVDQWEQQAAAGGGSVEAFHGTSSKVLARIARQGIKAGRHAGGADAAMVRLMTAAARSAKTPQALADLEAWKAMQKSSQGYTFVTQNRRFAEEMANTVAKSRGGKPVIFKVVMPSNEFARRMEIDPYTAPHVQAYKMKGDIKPEHIQSVATPSASFRSVAPLTKRDTGNVTCYVVLIPKEDELEKAGMSKFTQLEDRVLVLRDSVDFAIDMAKEFDESKHPRDKEGKWRVIGEAAQSIGRVVSRGKALGSWLDKNKGELSKTGAKLAIQTMISLASGMKTGNDPVTDQLVEHHVDNFSNNVGVARNVAARRLRQAWEMARRLRRSDVEKADSDDPVLAVMDQVIAALRRIENEEVEKFDPDQPRDAEGKWTDTGAGGKSGVLGRWSAAGGRAALWGLGLSAEQRARYKRIPATLRSLPSMSAGELAAGAIGLSARKRAKFKTGNWKTKLDTIASVAGRGIVIAGAGLVAAGMARQGYHALQPDMVLFHGTSSQAAARIMRQGLRTSAGGKSGGQKSGGSASDVFPLYRNISLGHVFASRSQREATAYANWAATHAKARPVVFKLRVPKSQAVYDTDPLGRYNVVRFSGDIRPEWIEAVAGPSGKFRPVPAGMRKAEQEETEEVYLAISFFPTKVRNEENDKVEKRFDPSQPRDEEGKWTDTGADEVSDPKVERLKNKQLALYDILEETDPGNKRKVRSLNREIKTVQRQLERLERKPSRLRRGLKIAAGVAGGVALAGLGAYGAAHVATRRMAARARQPSPEWDQPRPPPLPSPSLFDIARMGYQGYRAIVTAGDARARESPATTEELYRSGRLLRPRPHPGSGVPRIRLKKAAIAAALAKAFDPDQPRDEEGKWTDVGGGKKIPKDIPRFKNAVEARLWLNRHLGEELADLADVENVAAAMAAADTPKKRKEFKQRLDTVNRAVKLLTDAQKQHVREAVQGSGDAKSKLKRALKIGGAVYGLNLLLGLGLFAAARAGYGLEISSRAPKLREVGGAGSGVFRADLTKPRFPKFTITRHGQEFSGHRGKYAAALKAQRKLKLERVAAAAARTKELQRRMKRSGLTVVKRAPIDLDALVAAMVDQLSEAEARRIVTALLAQANERKS